jgi:hypothetical protein
MSALGPSLEAFFTDRLVGQRAASENTIAAYALAFRLLLGFASARRGIPPSGLDIAELDAPLVAAFSSISRASGGTLRRRATRASRRSIRCSPTWRCTILSTPARSGASCRSRTSEPR